MYMYEPAVCVISEYYTRKCVMAFTCLLLYILIPSLPPPSSPPETSRPVVVVSDRIEAYAGKHLFF